MNFNHFRQVKMESPEGNHSKNQNLKFAKEKSFQKMKLQKGHTVMDFGSGEGRDLNQLSVLVEQHGEVWAVDHDPLMIKQSIINNTKSNVRFLKSSSGRLNFPNDFFSSIRSQNVFEHLENINDTTNELIRVLREEGELVILSFDWSSIKINTNFPIIFNEILEHSLHTFSPNKLTSTELIGQLKTTQLKKISIEKFSISDTSLELFNQLFFNQITRSGIVKEKLAKYDIQLFLKDLIEKSKQDDFLFSIDLFLIHGKKSTSPDELTKSTLASSTSA